jgi:hypothetical protein
MKRAGGGKRGSRKPTRVEPDDRPRGYEATRMRQVWRDIDDAKHKAGLAGPAESATASWDVTTMLERAVALAGDVAAWIVSNAPAACAALASGADMLRGVPVVGRLVELVPLPAPPTEPSGTRAATPTHALDRHGNGTARTVVVDPTASGPDGGWVH